MLNGAKTIVAMLVAAYVVPLMAKNAVTLSADDQAQLVAVGVAVVGVVMRFFSNGPALLAMRDWLADYIAKRKQPAASTVDISEVTDGVIAEIKRRQAAAKEKKV